MGEAKTLGRLHISCQAFGLNCGLSLPLLYLMSRRSQDSREAAHILSSLWSKLWTGPSSTILNV